MRQLPDALGTIACRPLKRPTRSSTAGKSFKKVHFRKERCVQKNVKLAVNSRDLGKIVIPLRFVKLDKIHPK